MELQQPLGYRFYPTEEELVSFYLYNKLEGRNEEDMQRVIPVIDIYDKDPWDLPRNRCSSVTNKFTCFFWNELYMKVDRCVIVIAVFCVCRTGGRPVPGGYRAVVLLCAETGEGSERREDQQEHGFGLLESHGIAGLCLLVGPTSDRLEEVDGFLQRDSSCRRE